MTRRRIISVDFDATLHAYDGKWTAPDIISGPPILGAQKAMENYIAAGFDVIVCSARARSVAGAEAIERWTRDTLFVPLHATAIRPPAFVHIDDRCICFDGRHWPTSEEITSFRPWWKKGLEK